jgi:hypothetical protein
VPIRFANAFPSPIFQFAVSLPMKLYPLLLAYFFIPFGICYAQFPIIQSAPTALTWTNDSSPSGSVSWGPESGTNSNSVLRITGGAQARLAIPANAETLLVTTFRFKTAPAPQSDNPSDGEFSDASGSVVGFLTVGAEGAVYVLDGNGAQGGTWKKTNLTGDATGWVKLAIRQDFTTKKWDLWAWSGTQQKLVAHTLGFWDDSVTNPQQLIFVGFGNGDLLLDDFELCKKDQTSWDSDNDGVPDGWENTVGGITVGGHERLVQLASSSPTLWSHAMPTSASNAPAVSWWAPDMLELQVDLSKSLEGDLSGVTWNEDSSTFFAIQNNSGKRIVELSRTGQLLRVIWTSADESLKFDDPEAITWLGSNSVGHRFAIAEERLRKLVMVTIGREKWAPRVVASQSIALTYANYQSNAASRLTVGLVNGGANANLGLEGLCRVSPPSSDIPNGCTLLGALESPACPFKIDLTYAGGVYTAVCSPVGDALLAHAETGGPLGEIAFEGGNVYLLHKGVFSHTDPISPSMRIFPYGLFTAGTVAAADMQVKDLNTFTGNPEGLAVLPGAGALAIAGEPAQFTLYSPKSRRSGTGQPYISEIMADNVSGIKDKDGKTRDWVEVHNPSQVSFDFGYLGITFVYEEAGLVVAAATLDFTLQPGERRLLFASGKNFAAGNSELHLPFKLRAAGGALRIQKTVGGSLVDVTPPVVWSGAAGPDKSFGSPSDGTVGNVVLAVPTPSTWNSGGVVLATLDAPTLQLAGTPVSGSFISAGGDVTFVLPAGAPAGTKIFYTKDGSEPYLRNGPLPDAGRLFEAPAGHTLNVTATTIVRASCWKEGFTPSLDTTRTFILTSGLATQQKPATYPDSHDGSSWWGNVPSPAMSYATDPGFPVGDRVKAIDAIASRAPSISLVIDPQHLFWLQDGIYANSSKQTGVFDAERRVSFEYYDPADQPSGRSSLHAGIKIAGHSSRYWGNTPKHSFRLSFRDQYGSKRLNRPVFAAQDGDAAVPQEFETLILRSPMQDSFVVGGAWSNYRDSAKYVTDQWSNLRMAEFFQPTAGNTALRLPVPHRRWVNLFINGLYWGAYEMIEEPDGEFADRALGKAKYNIIKGPESPNIEDGVIAGGLAAATAWQEVINYGASFSVQNVVTFAGNNPVTTPEQYDAETLDEMAAIEARVDLQNLIDYVIFNVYLGNGDWPMHNWMVMSRRDMTGSSAWTDTRFRCLSWDAEYGLKVPFSQDSTTLLSQDGNMTSPAWLFHSMCRHTAFRTMVANRIAVLLQDVPVNESQPMLASDPLFKTLAPAAVRSSFDAAVRAFTGTAPGLPESDANGVIGLAQADAWRWGHVFPPAKYTAANWLATINTLRTSWIPNRTGAVRTHMTAYLARRASDVANELALIALAGEGGYAGTNNAGFIGGAAPASINDADGDGIPDAWEGTGRTVSAGPWAGFQVYTRTTPVGGF